MPLADVLCAEAHHNEAHISPGYVVLHRYEPLRHQHPIMFRIYQERILVEVWGSSNGF